MPKIVRETNGLGESLVQAKYTGNRSPDLSDLHRVRQSRSVEVAFVVDEDLRLINQSTKSVGVHDAIAVALKFTSHFRRGLWIEPTARARIVSRPRREYASACFLMRYVGHER
jgi:hypothetical protein